MAAQPSTSPRIPTASRPWQPPSNQSTGGTYKFPAGKTDGIKYDSEPGTDLDKDTLAYLITFTNPETDTEEEVTIPAEGTTAADLPGTLLTIERSGHNFILKPDGNVTPDQFETTYGDVESHHEEKTLEVQLWASDGTERSPPVDFTLRLHYDPSGYFPEPAENRSISRWELPGAIETSEGTDTLSGATVMWASPLAGARNWATGNPTTPVSCRHGPADQANQEWPDAGNEDSDLFTLDTSTTTGNSGSITLSFKAPPDFENPSDSDKDNTYKLRLHNTHDLDKATGGKVGFPACSGSAIDVTVIVINVNQPPVFPSNETGARSVIENTAAGQPIGDPVEAEDPDAGATLTYTLGGDDAASFDIIESTGQLQTKNDLDFEDKASYTVTVTATDQSNASNTITVTITITNVDENPEVSGEQTRDYAENGTDPVATYTTADPEDDQITWSLSGDDSSNFSISNTGLLTFSSSPDYEAPTDTDYDNVYLVTVLASDSANTDSLDVTINVTDENETPVVTGNSPINYPENNAGPVATYTAVDPENSQITWSLSGDDSGQFSITGGALTFNTPPDYEVPASADHDNEYLVTVQASDRDNIATLAVKVTVNDENEPPAFAMKTDVRTIAENTAAGQNIGAPFLATDPDADETLTYGLAGTDAASFGITPSTGQLQTKNDLDFEEKASYTVTVSVRDSRDDSGNTDTTTDATITITITVTDANDPPSVSGQTSVSYEENRTDTVATYTASDPEGTSIIWSLSGDDAEDFAINEGVLTFGSTPNFEDAADANTDNVYLATVEASDGSVKGTLDVTVTVTNENELPAFAEETAARTIAENTEAGQPIGDPVEAMDPDAGDSLTYTLSGTNAASFSIVATTGQLQTKAALDHEAKANYMVIVSVRDSKDANDNTDTKTDATITVAITVTDANEPPEFPSTETGARSVAENTSASRDIGLPVSATDPEIDPLTYSLDGTDAASFRIIESTGQLQTKANLDFEKKDRYTVTVLVHDGKDGSGNADTTTDDTVAVTITVTGENEPPKVTGHSSVNYAENGAADIATYTASDPEGTSITWYLLGNDNSLLSIDTLGVLTFNTAPDFEAPADADHDNEYLVTVRASDGDNVVTLTVTVTVTDENEPPTFATKTDARTIAEGTEAGVDIGMPVSATDPDAGETLTYSLAETDAASFSILKTTGQLQTKDALDFEDKASYTVTVTATDREGLSDTTQVTITVKDIGPPVPVTDLEGTFRSGDSSIIDLSWTTPDGFDQNGQVIPFPHTSHEVTGYTYQHRWNIAEEWHEFAASTPSTSASITGLDQTGYQVRISATNFEGDSGWSQITVGDLPNSPPSVSAHDGSQVQYMFPFGEPGDLKYDAPAGLDLDGDSLIYRFTVTLDQESPRRARFYPSRPMVTASPSTPPGP